MSDLGAFAARVVRVEMCNSKFGVLILWPPNPPPGLSNDDVHRVLLDARTTSTTTWTEPYGSLTSTAPPVQHIEHLGLTGSMDEVHVRQQKAGVRFPGCEMVSSW